MTLDTAALLALPAAEKLALVEMLWDNLGQSPAGIPLPEWVEREALRRREEMIANPASGLTHVQIWQRINERGR